jgi:hypothetical protein
MFRKTLLIAALALSAALPGLARADGEAAGSNITETLRPAQSLGENAMRSAGLPRLEVIAGMERPVAVYDGPSTQQNYAAPSTNLRVTPTFEGSYRTERN